MDREISKSEQDKGRFKIIIKYLIIAAAFVFAYFMLQKFLRGSVDSSSLVTAKVEQGEIENLISATGRVIPYYERVINAPVSTEIKAVLLQSGDQVRKGDLIMELDQEFTRLEYEQLNDELEVKSNNIVQLKLEYDKNLRDLDYRNQIKGLQVEELEAQLKDQQRLHQIGGATAEEVEKVELQLKVSQLDKKILENELDYRKRTNETEKRNLELELEIQKKKLKELNRKLRETSVTAPDDGVITWINEDLGKKLQEGQEIVKIANLDQFKIEASASDRYTSRLDIGIPVRVRVEGKNVNGAISNILPAVENNTVRFNVTIDDKDASLLRANMRVEVFIVTDRKENILRIRNGSAFSGANVQEVFRVEEGIAKKTKVNIGLRNADYVEIFGDVQAGDEFIISDTEDFEHRDQFDIKNND